MFNNSFRKFLFAVGLMVGLSLGGFPLNPSSELCAQTGKNTAYWNWTERGKHHDAIVRIESGEGSGTGVIVRVNKDKPVGTGFEGWCLTAWHVVSGDNDLREIAVEYANGERAKRCKVIAHDEHNDVALLWVWVPSSVEAASIAEKSVVLGDQIEFAGLGGNSKLKCCIRHFLITASMSTNPKQLFADVPLLPGDSGGPVFNSDQQLVGIISGGWFWLDAGVKSESGESVRVTWPARAGNLGTIEKLLSQGKPSQTLVAKQ